MQYPIALGNQLREHLRALRQARGLTQAALGELLGVKQARIAEIEANPLAVSVEQLLRVVAALNSRLLIEDNAAPPVTENPLSPSRSAAAAKRALETREPSSGSTQPAFPSAARKVVGARAAQRRSGKVETDAPTDKSDSPSPPRILFFRPHKGKW